jgi:protein gp37
MGTNIPWCDETLNPIAGCTKISPACDHCYAEKMAYRLAGMTAGKSGKEHIFEKYERTIDGQGRWTGKVSLDISEMDKAKKWKKPKRIFVVSMGDLFHESVPFDFIVKVFDRMQQLPRHTFQVLTKRPARMLEFCGNYGIGSGNEWPVNIWAGVTAENQERADERIPVLLRIPAAKRFVSIEPMLSSIDLQGPLDQRDRNYLGCPCGGNICSKAAKLDWVIVGGETDPGARPMHPEWARGLRYQCQDASIPFFFKGFGDWLPYRDNGPLPFHCSYVGLDGKVRVGDAETDFDACMGKRLKGEDKGRLLDGRTWEEFPEDEEEG